MRVGCIICSDTFSNFADVATVPCGHTFHSHCLLQWMETSNSCPVCRQKATVKKVLKLFFECVGNETEQLDPDQLQNQVDSLKFQVVEKTQLLNNCTDLNEKYERDLVALRNECKVHEELQKKHKSVVTAYKEQVKHLNSKVEGFDRLKEESDAVKSEMKLLKDIRELVRSSSDDIDATIVANNASQNSSRNIRSLATICCVLKSRMNKLISEKNQISNNNRSNLSKYQQAKQESEANEAKIAEMELELSVLKNDIQSLETENRGLQKKLASLQSAIVSPSGDLKDSLVRRLVMESPAPLHLKENMINQPDFCTPEVVRTKLGHGENGSIGNKASQEKGESPFLQLKSASFPAVGIPTFKSGAATSMGAFKSGRGASSSNSGPLRFTHKYTNVQPVIRPGDSFGFDGLGGHSKVDEFPRPLSADAQVKRKVSVSAPKSKKMSNGQTKISSKSIKQYFNDPFSDF